MRICILETNTKYQALVKTDTFASQINEEGTAGLYTSSHVLLDFQVATLALQQSLQAFNPQEVKLLRS